MIIRIWVFLHENDGVMANLLQYLWLIPIPPAHDQDRIWWLFLLMHCHAVGILPRTRIGPERESSILLLRSRDNVLLWLSSHHAACAAFAACSAWGAVGHHLMAPQAYTVPLLCTVYCKTSIFLTARTWWVTLECSSLRLSFSNRNQFICISFTLSLIFRRSCVIEALLYELYGLRQHTDILKMM